MDLFLTLRIFDPHGVEVTFKGANDPQAPVSQGWLRVSQRRLDPARSKPYRPFHPHDGEDKLDAGHDLRGRRRNLADLDRASEGLHDGADRSAARTSSATARPA